MTTDFPVHRGHDNPFLALGSGGSGAAAGSGGLATYTPPAAVKSEPSAFRRVHALLRGRYVLAAALCLLGAAAGAYFGFKTPKPKYTSSGTVELKLIVPSIRQGDRIMLLAGQFMANQVNTITNARVIQAAMTSREWQETGKGNSADTQTEFMRNLDVEILPGSTYIKVAYTDEDPKVARAAVSSVIRSYEQLYQEFNNDETRKKETLLKNLRTQRANTIEEKKEQILGLAQAFGTADLTTLHNAKVEGLVRLEGELNQAKSTLAGIEAAMKRAGGGSTTQPAEESAEISAEEIASVDPTVRELTARLRDMDFQLQRLSKALPSGHRTVIEAQRDYSLVKGQLDDALRAFRARYFAIRADPTTGAPIAISHDTLRQLTERVQHLQQQYDREKELTRSIGEKKLSIQALNYDIDRLKGELEIITRNIDDISNELLMGGEIKVISTGDTPSNPSVDNRKKMAAMGLAGGAMVPLGLLLLVGLIDTRYRYSDDHGDHMPNVPLLGILPNLPNLANDPQQATTAAHCVHQIRTMLEIAAETQGRRAFAITSPAPTDGKTSLSLALGLSFAAAGNRTLLIDCDVIGGGLSARMNQTHTEGTLEAVATRQMAPYIRPTDVANLSILPVGTASAHHPTILSPSAVGRLVADAKAAYDVVLIDTGPVLGSVEASPVCAAADAVVLVVSRGRHKSQVAKSLEHLVSIGSRLAGVVFNRATTPDFERSTSRLAERAISSSVQA